MAMTFRYSHFSPKHKTRIINILGKVLSQNPPHTKKVVGITAETERVQTAISVPVTAHYPIGKR